MADKARFERGQRSIKSRKSVSPKILSGTATGNRWTGTLFQQIVTDCHTSDIRHWFAMTRKIHKKERAPTSVGALCSRYLSSRVGQVLSCRPKHSGGVFQAAKTPTLRLRFLCSRYLSSRAVTRQVLSAYMSLTSVFGMGTGGPS